MGEPTTGMTLLDDPHFPWHGQFPYREVAERLRAKGVKPVGPDASAAEINDALFHLMRREEREILDDLRYPERRVLFDFMLYQVAVPTAAEVAAAVRERPLPLAEPDVAPLCAAVAQAAADDLVAATTDSPSGAAGDLPLPLDLSSHASLGCVDIGELTPVADAILNDHDQDWNLRDAGR